VSVASLLEGKRVCVCGGSGGVGKTTTSAAIALGMAAEGAKVAVVTIDPAKRLANALGLQELENEPRRVEPERLEGIEVKGELWAMMLDPKRTFDELIERIAPDPGRAAEIKSNRVYRELSTAVSGSQEFTAVAKLYELDRDGDFDLLVLDTPPSRNALDFLEAPGRLTSFLDGHALKAFVRPTSFGMRVLGRGAAPFLGALSKVTGVDLLSDLTTFFGLLGGMTDDFSERAVEVEKMLRAETTAFVLVTSAQPAAIDEAVWFRRTLGESGLPFAGVIINRVHHDVQGDADPADLRTALGDGLPADLVDRVAQTFADYHVLARRDQAGVQRLAAELADRPRLLVPHLDDDVHDIDGLLRVHRFLFASDAERERLIADVIA
jgi:anion-transporting  ArsA/GET3 family ATPase